MTFRKTIDWKKQFRFGHATVAARRSLVSSDANRLFYLVTATLVFFVTGCTTEPPGFKYNAAQQLKLEKTKFGDGERLDSKYRTEIESLMAEMFGTPDKPLFPFLEGENDPSHELVSMERLADAGGPIQSDREGKQGGLYREHCAHCHGVTGDGMGPTALTLNPYPRDFRLGKFKFKSTPLRAPPTDDDMMRILREGIPGTAMPSFKALPNEELLALTDYVKYLAVRGEFERLLIDFATELDGEPLISATEQTESKGPAADPHQARRQAIADFLDESLIWEQVRDRWLDRDDNVTEVPEYPDSLDFQSEAFKASAVAGQRLFVGRANCIQCHGTNGLGDGQVGNFDDWTNDWLKTPGVDLAVQATYQDFLKAGVLPPRPIKPRNLNFPFYHGGGNLGDLYLRIKNGIEGTPMPSSVGLTDQEIWDLVAFVKSLPYTDLTQD